METQKWQNLNALCQVEQREAIVRKHLKYTGRPREDKGDFYKVCLYKIHSALTPDEECFFSSLVQGGNLSYRSFMFLLYLVLGKKRGNWNMLLASLQFSRSVVSDSLRPHERSTPGLPVHHQLLEPTQTHVH